MATRVLSIGWDGADLRTVDSMIARGALPNLARLRESGREAPLEALAGLADDAHWSSFATSSPPGVHGRFHHHQPVPGRYRQRLFSRDAIAADPFWEQLAAAGLRVGVLDVPKSPLGSHPDLRVVADWMPHGEDGPSPISVPGEFAKEMNTRYGSPPPLDCHRVIHAGEEQQVAASIRERLELRTRAALDWLEGEDWDLVQVTFAESHCIGHHCWHIHDRSHPAHRADARELLGDVVEDIYARQDAALGRLVAAAGPESAVIVFSPLGMGPNYSGDPLVQPVLDRISGTQLGDAPFWAGAVRRTPRWLLRGLPPLERRARSLDQSPFRTLPYWHLRHDAISSAIRLNVVGRDPAGMVNPGIDFERHRDLLTDSFRSLRRVSDGTPVVADIVDVASVYPGPQGDRFADLHIVWDSTAPIAEVTSPTLGRIVAPSKPARTGNHRTPGWAVFAGDDLDRGSRSCTSLVDLGPIIAEQLGVLLEGGVRPAPSLR